MNSKIAILGLVEIISSISIGVIILSVTYTLLKRYGKRKFDVSHDNLSYSIFVASVLFGVGYMVSGVIQPIISSFRVLSTTELDYHFMLVFLGYGFIYILIAYVFGLIVSLSGIFLYSNLTPIDEFQQIKNNNIGVALIVSAIIITLILMSRGGVMLIIESIIPYPTLPPK